MMRARVTTSVLLVLLAAACAGTTARIYALWPRVVAAWPEVRKDVELGLASNPSQAAQGAVEQIDLAIQADDYELLGDVNWSALTEAAKAGVLARVADGMSEGVADSLRNQNLTFAIALRELTGR